MSIAVDLDRLRDEAARFPVAYLLTVNPDGRPHAVAVAVGWGDGSLELEAGRRTGTNAAERPRVSVLWPPTEPGGYSLIVDGDAALDGERVVVAPTRAVLHRPAPAPQEGSACGSDCVPLAAPRD